MARIDDVIDFYKLLDNLQLKIGGSHTLADPTVRNVLPKKGVYFFMESGECRSDSGQGPRVVRVGTHMLTLTSRRTLWNRLSQHRGRVNSNGGNHRSSIFRGLVGEAVIHRGGLTVPTWGGKSLEPRA